MLTFNTHKKIDKSFPRQVSMLLVAILLMVTPTLSVHAQTGDDSPRYGADQRSYEGAIEKVGFYLNISRDRVTIIDEKSYRKRSYQMAADMIITRQNQDYKNSQEPRVEIDQRSLFPHSLVKLIVVDAEVIELILIQESS